MRYPALIPGIKTVILSLLVLISSQTHAQELIDRIVAVVDDDVIMLGELRREAQELHNQLSQKKVQPMPTNDRILSTALDQLIIHKLQLAEAERLGIQVDQETLNRAMASIAQNNSLSLMRFRDALAEEGISYPQFQAHIRDTLMIRRLINQEVSNRIEVSRVEVDQELARQRKQQQQEQAPTDLVQQTLARHILIRTDELTSDNDARERLTQLRERISNGEDFASLARSHSSDQASAIKGGDLGWVSPESLTPAFTQQMDNTPVQSTSQPFKTRFGWHIVQVLDRRNHDQSAELQRLTARKAVQERKAKEAKKQYLRKLRAEAYVEVRAGN